MFRYPFKTRPAGPQTISVDFSSESEENLELEESSLTDSQEGWK